jgi:erythromycin esterase
MVRDATGAPLAGALVAAVPADATETGRVAGLVTSNADGTFALERLAPAAYGVTATAGGHEGAFVGHVVVEATQPARADLKLGAGGVTFDGTVTDLGGHPIGAALVACGRSSKEAGDVWFTKADAAGAFRITVPRASYTIVAKVSGYGVRPEYVDGTTAPSPIKLEVEPDDVTRFAGSAVVDGLRAASVAIATTDPAADSMTDLDRVARFVGNARIVGLGEGVHGGHEIFSLKHRLFRYLVEKLGFSVLAIEASWPDTIALNDYVLHGRGDPAQLAPGMRFWIWDTDEMIALVRWMRAYNADPHHTRKVQFIGFDMQYAPTSVAALRTYLGRVDRAWSARVAHDLGSLGDEYDAGHVERWPAAERDATKRAVGELLAAFDEHKAAWTRRTGADDWAVARHHAEILSQFLQLGTDWRKYNDTRDRAMAENIEWIVGHQPPGTRIALWAANTHLSKVPWYGTAPNTGSLLRDAYGEAYVVFAFSFVSGAIRAASISPPRGLMAFEVPTAPPGSIEGTLGRIGPDIVGVDLAHLDPGSDAARWSHFRLQMRLIGAAYTESMKGALVTVRPADLYDALFVIRTLTPSRYSGPMEPPKPPLARAQNLDFEAVGSAAPPGWVVSSLGIRSGYRASVAEHDCFEGARCGMLSRPGPILMPAFGSLQQSIEAKDYRGHKVRLRAAVRLDRDVESGGARLFLQSEDRDGNVLAKGNTTDSSIRGKRWVTAEISVDVAPNSAVLRYGLILSGSDSAWLDAITLEPIDAAAPRAPAP